MRLGKVLENGVFLLGEGDAGEGGFLTVVGLEVDPYARHSFAGSRRARHGYGDVMLSTETWYAGYQQYGPQLDNMSEILPWLKA